MIKTHVWVTLQLANLYRFFIKDYNIFVIYSVWKVFPKYQYFI